MPKRKREEEAGAGIVGDLYQKARSALLDKPTTSFSAWLKTHSSDPIFSLEVVRTPLASALNLALNIATAGKFAANRKKYNYNEVYHLYFVINGEWRVEKNHVVEAKKFKPERDMEVQPVSLRGTTRTVGQLIRPTGTSYWLYSTVYNCQNWVLRNLETAGLLTPNLRAFIFQDPLKLLEGTNTNNLSVVTDLAAAVAHYAPWPIRKLAGGRIKGSGPPPYTMPPHPEEKPEEPAPYEPRQPFRRQATATIPELMAALAQIRQMIRESSNPDELGMFHDQERSLIRRIEETHRRASGGRVANKHAKRTGALMRKHKISLAEASRRAAAASKRRVPS